MTIRDKDGNIVDLDEEMAKFNELFRQAMAQREDGIPNFGHIKGEYPPYECYTLGNKEDRRKNVEHYANMVLPHFNKNKSTDYKFVEDVGINFTHNHTKEGNARYILHVNFKAAPEQRPLKPCDFGCKLFFAEVESLHREQVVTQCCMLDDGDGIDTKGCKLCPPNWISHPATQSS